MVLFASYFAGESHPPHSFQFFCLMIETKNFDSQIFFQIKGPDKKITQAYKAWKCFWLMSSV